MLNDDEARRLLNRAGETVTVDPAAPIDDRPRRRVWPVLAAAAAVGVLAVTTVLITAPGTHEDPTPAPPVADEIQIPSLLGYDLTSAVASLRDLGLTWKVETVPTCNADYVRGTQPAAGTPVEPGAEVVVQHAIPTMGFCISEDQLAVDLLALADGRGDGPPLADDLEVYDATGRTDLDTVLDRLSGAAHSFYPSADAGRYVSPELSTGGRTYDESVSPPARCHYAGGPDFGAREHVSIWVGVENSAACPEFVIDAYRTGDAVDALVLRTLGEESEPDPEPQPSLGTAFRDFARGGELPPIADQVDLYLGNAFTGFVTKASASDRQAWATCTETGSYAARSCPLSPLEVLERHRAVDYTDRPEGICMPTFGPVPPDLRALDRVTIVPAEGSISSCIQNFAVQLFANSDGELVAVSLLLGEP